MATSEVSSAGSLGLVSFGLALLSFRSLLQPDVALGVCFSGLALVFGVYAQRRSTGWGRMAALAGAALGTLVILGFIVIAVLLSQHIDPFTGQRIRT